jgi:hypothetical protein
MYPRKENNTLARFLEIKKLKELLEQKYTNIDVKMEKRSANLDQLSVVLLNGRHGVDDGIDKENARPIEFLKSFGATVTQEKGTYSYWSNSVITFNSSRINDIIQGLEALPTPNQENNHGKVMAMC